MLSLNQMPIYLDIIIEKPGYLPFYERIFSVDFSPTFHSIKLRPIQKGESFSIQAIYFDHNSDVIKEESYLYLKRLAEYLVKNDNIKLKVIGHTDLHGKSDFNDELSEKRATSVRKYLIKLGVQKNRLTVEGAGESLPVINNTSPKADRLNRRTEFKVIDI